MLNHMKKNNYSEACPRNHLNVGAADDFFGLTSGYLERAKNLVPKQGLHEPWVLSQNCMSDLLSEPFEKIEDDTLQFVKKTTPLSARL